MARTNRGGSRRSGGDPKKSVAPQDEEFVELDPEEMELDNLDEDDDEAPASDSGDDDSDDGDDSDDDVVDEDGADDESDDGADESEDDDDEPDESDDEADEDEDDLDDDDDDDEVGALGGALSGGTKSGAKKSGAKKSGADRPGRKKTKGASRRERIAALQEKERREKRSRSVRLAALCIVLALAVLAYPVYLFVQESIITATPRVEIGVPASEAGCMPDEEHLASGNQEHVPDGTIVEYPRLPPDSGPHYNQWTDFGETFYSVSDRPEVERLVHNLEHGYTVLWYNSDTISADELKWVQALAKTYNGTDPVENKFKAAPWSPTYDGGGFPDETKFILTRWTADPQNPTDVTKQFGVRMACNQLSGQAVEEFMDRYPQPNSPEPYGG